MIHCVDEVLPPKSLCYKITFQLCFSAQFPGISFSIFLKSNFKVEFFYHFPCTVVFQQENEIPVNVQQDSCSNQAIIFVREGILCVLIRLEAILMETQNIPVSI